MRTRVLIYFLRTKSARVGVYYGEGPPVPIPNTEVKLTCADNTWLETAWEDRYMPTLNKTAFRLFFVLYSDIRIATHPEFSRKKPSA